MPDLRPLSKAVSRPVRAVGDAVARMLGDFRKQAPGARMVGEFAVKAGLTELGRRIAQGKKDAE